MADDYGMELTVRHGSFTMGLADALYQDLISDSVKPENHFMELECKNGTRYIHRIVLKTCYPDFDETKTKIPVSTEICDRITEFIYTGETTLGDYFEVMGAYEAAKLLNWTDLTRSIERGIETHLHVFLTNFDFLRSCGEDSYERFAKIIPSLRLDDETRSTLLQRMMTVESKDTLLKMVMDCKRSPRLYCSYANSQFPRRALVDATTFERTTCRVDFDLADVTSAVILNKRMFAKSLHSSALLIMLVRTGEEVQKIPIPDLSGITIFEGEPFVWTKEQLFRLKKDTNSRYHSLELILSGGHFNNVRILRRTDELVLFARESRGDVEVVKAVKKLDSHQFTVVQKEAKCQLVGNVDDTVYTYSKDCECIINLQTCGRFRSKFIAKVRSRRILNGSLYTMTSADHRITVWKTDLRSRRSLCSGLNEVMLEGHFIEWF